MAQTITIKINGKGNGKKPKARSKQTQRMPKFPTGSIWGGTAFGGRGFGTQHIPGVARRTRIGIRRTRLTAEQTVGDIRGAGREARLLGGDVVKAGKATVGAGRVAVRGGRAVFGAAKSISGRFRKKKPKSFPKITSKEFRAGQKAIPKMENRGPKPVKVQTQNQIDDLNRKRRSIKAFDRAASGKP